MAARIGFKLTVLRRLDPSACESDARVVMKSGDEHNVGIVRHDGEMFNLGLSGTREMRLLANQLYAIADYLDRQPEEEKFEVILP